MAVDIGPKIGITGEREFRNQLQQTNQALKTLAAESKAVSSAFDAETDAEKKSAAQKDVLNRQIQTQKDKLILLEKGLQEAAQKFGEADTRTMKWQQAVHEGTAQLNNMERQLTGMDPAIDETTDSMEQAGEATRGWADVMKGQLLADFVKNGLKKIADLTKSIGTAMWDVSKAGAAYADDILTLATTTGLSTDELQEYKYMADLVDVSLETLTGSLTKLTSNMAKAKDGEGEAAAVFKELEVSVTDSNGQLRKAKDVFKDTITALGKVKNETDRDTKAMTLFGKSAKELNPMIAAGADEMEALAKEAHRTGYVLSGEALTALGKQQDAMERLDRKAEALRNNFAAKMAPGITKAYDKIGETLDNPRVQRGMDKIGEGIGNIIGKAADLAAKALPDLIAFFSGDVQLRTFTDAEIELAKRADEAAEAYQNMVDTYKANAVTILAERDRTKDLWKELQTLVEADGFVVDANKDRVDFILKELNEALGSEYERNGDIIKQYETMGTEIDNLIQKKTAEKLLDAEADAYTQALQNQQKDVELAGDLYQQLLEAKMALGRAEVDLIHKQEEGRKKDVESLWKYTSEQRVAVDNAKAKIAELQSKYDEASAAAVGNLTRIERYERAQTEALQGNYRTVVGIMSNEIGATIDYYKQKQQLSAEDRRALEERIRSQEHALSEYRRMLKAGAAGITEDFIAEQERAIQEAKDILDGKAVADQWINGMVIGLTDKQNRARVAAAAAAVAELVPKEARRTMEIRSPSHLAEWMTTMWDEGLIKGLGKKKAEVAAASASVSAGIAALGAPNLNGYSYGNAMTAVGGVVNNSTSSYTTNMGGITIPIYTSGPVNEEALADRVTAKLTGVLQRAQRGGRR